MLHKGVDADRFLRCRSWLVFLVALVLLMIPRVRLLLLCIIDPHRWRGVASSGSITCWLPAAAIRKNRKPLSGPGFDHTAFIASQRWQFSEQKHFVVSSLLSSVYIKKKKKKLHSQYIKFGTVLAIGRTKLLLDVILTVGDNGRSQ